MRSNYRSVLTGVLAVGALLASACSSGADGPTVLVDFSHDEFNSQFNAFFPQSIKVHPGERLTFKQTWTGEPHTVTFGTIVDEMLEQTNPLLRDYGDVPEDEIPGWVFETFDAATSLVPESSSAADDDAFNQTTAQPCYLDDGPLPEDESPCPEVEAPAFDGSQHFYNSGIIPFDGPNTNVFVMDLAEDIPMGTYNYFCIVHGPFMRGAIEVVPLDEPVATPAEIALQAREQVASFSDPLVEGFRRVRDEGVMIVGSSEFTGNFAGVGIETVGISYGVINEFVPREVTAKVGEPVTWVMFGGHSIAFDVPEYYPIVEFKEDGSVDMQAGIHEPIGGSPPLPEDESEETLIIDGGTWPGSGFFSSGTMWAPDHVEYTLRFAKAGTYAYACLIHPPMVGKIRVIE